MPVSRANIIRKAARSYEESLAGMYPQLLAEWDYEKNPFSPEAPVPGSTVMAHWICLKGHEYQKQIAKRAQGNSGCPYCSTHSKFLKGFNDLQTRYPELSLQWDHQRNSVGPDEVKATENRVKRFWICAESHGWSASVQNRAARGSGCPECSNKTSKGELELLEYVRALGYEAKYTDRTVIAPYEIDIWIPELRLGLEFNGIYWHSDKLVRERSGMSSEEYHRMKNELAEAAGARLAFVWQNDWVLEPEQTRLAVKSWLEGAKVESLAVYEKPYSLELLRSIQQARQ